jgi:spore coat protein U-like protein
MKFTKKLLAATLLTIGGFAAISSANAETDTGAFDVNVTVTKICDVTSATGTQDINLGSFAAGVDVTTGFSSNAISVNCSNGTAYNIGLAGSGFLVDTVTPENKVAYSLLKASGGTVWGNNITGEVGGTGTGMATDQIKTHTVFASLAADSTDNLPPGTYKDNVTVTLTY